MSLRLVLFDLDGTLADTAADIARAANLALAEAGRKPFSVEHVRSLVSSGARRLLASSYDDDPGKEEIDRLTHRLFEHYAERPAEHTRVFDGLGGMIEELESSGLRWGIVSNKPVGLVRPIVETLSLAPPPVCVLGGDSLATRKPDPRPLLHACELAGETPVEALYVGDAEIDVRAARAAGMAAAIVGFGYAPEESVVREWNPDYYAESVPALRALIHSLRTDPAPA